MKDYLEEVLISAVDKKASDIHLTVGAPFKIRINGDLEDYDDKILTPEETEKLVKLMLDDRNKKELEEKGSVDFSYSIPKKSRFRVNVYKQRGTYSAVLRILGEEIPKFGDFPLPRAVKPLTKLKRGLVLVTGPTGSGKSTTLAAMVNHINETRKGHIITVEDPIEFMHKHKKCIVNQRELGEDTVSFSHALRGAMRQDPDIILVGELRDLETIEVAMTAAETGHLVLATLHTIGAAETIERIVDVFPAGQQQQIRAQLSNVLQAVISQQLLPTTYGRAGAFEVMVKTVAISNLIGEGDVSSMNNQITMGRDKGMITMDNSIFKLYASGDITEETALNFAVDKKALGARIKEI